MKMEVVDSLKVKNVPTDQDLERCAELGRKVASAVIDGLRD
jgi:flavorubredoxin